MAVKYVCENCGTDDVTVDAVMRWNIIEQKWIVSDNYDGAHCGYCQEEASIKPVPLEEI